MAAPRASVGERWRVRGLMVGGKDWAKGQEEVGICHSERRGGILDFINNCVKDDFGRTVVIENRG